MMRVGFDRCDRPGAEHGQWRQAHRQPRSLPGIDVEVAVDGVLGADEDSASSATGQQRSKAATARFTTSDRGLGCWIETGDLICVERDTAAAAAAGRRPGTSGFEQARARELGRRDDHRAAGAAAVARAAGVPIGADRAVQHQLTGADLHPSAAMSSRLQCTVLRRVAAAAAAGIARRIHAAVDLARVVSRMAQAAVAAAVPRTQHARRRVAAQTAVGIARPMAAAVGGQDGALSHGHQAGDLESQIRSLVRCQRRALADVEGVRSERAAQQHLRRRSHNERGGLEVAVDEHPAGGGDMVDLHRVVG